MCRLRGNSCVPRTGLAVLTITCQSVSGCAGIGSSVFGSTLMICSYSAPGKMLCANNVHVLPERFELQVARDERYSHVYIFEIFCWRVFSTGNLQVTVLTCSLGQRQSSEHPPLLGQLPMGGRWPRDEYEPILVSSTNTTA
jgi:hypothetical protein